MRADELECAVTREMWVIAVERACEQQVVASTRTKCGNELRILE
jgi:hypothetical protein